MSNLELCCECDGPTGRAGLGEDSLYAGEHGPYCEDCWDAVPEELAARVARLERVNVSVKGEVDALRAALKSCVEELESWMHDTRDGVWTKGDFDKALEPFRAALKGG